MKKVVVKKNRYVDSVSLMGVSERVTAMAGIENAEAQMATCANQDVLKMLGYELPENVSPNDLVIAITADNEDCYGAALQLAEDVRQGMDWETLTERRVLQLIANTYPVFSVDTLEYLMKGGRIGKVTATAGMLLQIKPLLTFAPDGQLVNVAKVRGKHQVIDKLVELTVKACGNHKRYNLAIANGGDPEGMEIVREKLTAALPGYDHIWAGEIDSTLSVYIGDGVLGAAVQVLDE